MSVDEIGFDLGPDEGGRGLLDPWARTGDLTSDATAERTGRLDGLGATEQRVLEHVAQLTAGPMTMADPAASVLLAEFVSSLPPAYAQSLEPAAVWAHAQLAQARGTRAALAGPFESERTVGQGICVVAEDRPGLLAAVSAALVMCAFDVVCAEAYTRRPPSGAVEAVATRFG